MTKIAGSPKPIKTSQAAGAASGLAEAAVGGVSAKLDGLKEAKAAPEVQAKATVDAKTVRGARTRAASAEGKIAAQLSSKLDEGTMASGKAGVDPKLLEEPAAPAQGDYTKRQREAMDMTLKEGEVIQSSDDEPLPKSMRTTPDGKVLPAKSDSVLINLGNSAEMTVIKTPGGEYYKQMVDGPAERMTRAEVDQLRKTIKLDDPMGDPSKRVGNDYKRIYLDLHPNAPIELEH